MILLVPKLKHWMRINSDIAIAHFQKQIPVQVQKKIGFFPKRSRDAATKRDEESSAIDQCRDGGGTNRGSLLVSK
jgi:hypothetical protein